MDLLSDFERNSTALIVEVTGPCAALILGEKHNSSFSFFTPHSPKSLWSGSNHEYEREQTPTDLVDKESKTYFRLPWTTEHQKVGYVFGRREEDAHFKLPPALGKAVSAAHFKVFLGNYGTWMFESISSNGTMFLGLVRQFEQKALHPDEPNEIRIGDLRLLLHIPNEHVPCQLKYELYHPHSGYREISIRQTPPASIRSSSVSGVSQELPSKLHDEEDEYHVCKKRPILPDMPRKYMAVRIRDGRPCIVKDYPGTKADFTRILGLSRSCESVVSYIEYLHSGELGSLIITDYIPDAQTLEEKMADERLEPSTVALVYGKLVESLRFLELAGLIHRDIRPGTILVSPRGAWLTGFSACVLAVAAKKWSENRDYSAPEVQSGDRYDSRSDIYSLSLVCYRSLFPGSSPENTSMPHAQKGDPSIISLLTQGTSDEPDRRQLASQTSSYLESMMGHRLEMPFNSFVVSRKWPLVSLNHEGVMWIRVKDLLDAVYSSGSDDRAELRSRLRQAKLIKGQEYLPLRAARKLCHRFRLDAFDAHLRSQTSSAVVERVHSVYCHTPSLMYNLDQLLRIAGRELAVLCMESFTPISRQEVRGVKEWEGTYVDSETFKEIAKFLGEKGDLTIRRRQRARNDLLAQRFSSTVARDTIILVTERFEYNMLYFRRADGFINWNPFSQSTYISPEDSLTKCNDLEMPELQTTILTLLSESNEFQWPLPHLMWDVDWDSDATSIKSTSSFDSSFDSDHERFRFKKPTKDTT